MRSTARSPLRARSVLDVRGHPHNEHKLGLEYNVATIGFVHGIDAAGARIALDNEDLLRSGCIKVDFCAGHEHDVTMDDELDEGDFDGSDDIGSGDEMDF